MIGRAENPRPSSRTTTTSAGPSRDTPLAAMLGQRYAPVPNLPGYNLLHGSKGTGAPGQVGGARRPNLMHGRSPLTVALVAQENTQKATLLYKNGVPVVLDQVPGGRISSASCGCNRLRRGRKTERSAAWAQTSFVSKKGATKGPLSPYTTSHAGGAARSQRDQPHEPAGRAGAGQSGAGRGAAERVCALRHHAVDGEEGASVAHL
jgi:hypothetical protein